MSRRSKRLGFACLLALTSCDSGQPLLAEAVLTPARRALDHAQRAASPTLALAPQIVDARPPAHKGVSDAPKGYVVMTPLARSGDFGNAILLVHPNEDVVVPIYVGGTEALSIQLRLEEKRFRRPLTHDLLDTLAEQLGAKMLRAQVNAVERGVYVGSVVFERSGGVIELDARPSDAIALAIGNRVPIYVSDEVVREAGVRPDDARREAPAPTADPVAL